MIVRNGSTQQREECTAAWCQATKSDLFISSRLDLEETGMQLTLMLDIQDANYDIC